MALGFRTGDVPFKEIVARRVRGVLLRIEQHELTGCHECRRFVRGAEVDDVRQNPALAESVQNAYPNERGAVGFDRSVCLCGIVSQRLDEVVERRALVLVVADLLVRNRGAHSVRDQPANLRVLRAQDQPALRVYVPLADAEFFLLIPRLAARCAPVFVNRRAALVYRHVNPSLDFPACFDRKASVNVIRPVSF